MILIKRTVRRTNIEGAMFGLNVKDPTIHNPYRVAPLDPKEMEKYTKEMEERAFQHKIDMLKNKTADMVQQGRISISDFVEIAKM